MFTARYELISFIRQITVRLARVKVLVNSQLKPGFDINVNMWNF